VLPIVAAMGVAAEVAHCLYLCGVTWRAGSKGANNDMIVKGLERQCGAKAAHAAPREDFVFEAFASADAKSAAWFQAMGLPPPRPRTAVILGTTQLLRATMLNNLSRVRQLIQLDAPLEAPDNDPAWRYSPLHHAARLGHSKVAEALLVGKYEGRGAAVDAPNAWGGNALSLASFFGHVDTVRVLLAHGASVALQGVNVAGGGGPANSAMHSAISADRPDVLALLCAAPGAVAALALRDTSGRTPLASALVKRRTICEAGLRAIGAIV